MGLRIGIDMVGAQTPWGRGRGIHRYTESLVHAWVSGFPRDQFFLYTHAGYPGVRAFEYSNVVTRELAGSPQLGAASVEEAQNRLVASNPDRLDALVLSLPISGHGLPQRVRGPLKLFSLFYDAIPFLFPEAYLCEPQTAQRFYRSLALLGQYDGLLTISKSAKDDADQIFGAHSLRVHPIGCASDPSLFYPPGGPSDTFHLSTLGSLGIQQPFFLTVAGPDYRKNADGFMEAFARLPEPVRSNTQLVIVGIPDDRRDGGTYPLTVKEFAAKLGIESRLVSLPRVPIEVLRTLYQRCIAFVLASLYEGFGLPLLEAMHCGAPVIGGANSSQVELVEGAGFLVPPRNFDLLAHRMEEIYRDGKLAAELRRRSEERAAQYRWSDVAQRAHEAVAATVLQPVPATERTALKPRMAFFSPLPPKASGISDYSVSLLRALTRHYTVDVYHDPHYVPFNAFSDIDFGVFDARLFEQRHGIAPYDEIVYQLGNSRHHVFALEALKRFPGTAVLHEVDFTYLGQDIHDPNILETVANRATSLLVHSQAAAKRLDRFGSTVRRKTYVVPMGSTITAPSQDRDSLRRKYGLPLQAPVVGAFGLLHPTKLNTETLHAFSRVRREMPTALLLFVGLDVVYGEAQRAASALGLTDAVRFLDRVHEADFLGLMGAVDVAVNLRRFPTHGETSASLLRLLGLGTATIISDVDAFSELPDSVALKIRKGAEKTIALSDAMLALLRSPQRRRRLGEAAKSYVANNHTWSLVAERYRWVLERSAQDVPVKRPIRSRPKQKESFHEPSL